MPIDTSFLPQRSRFVYGISPVTLDFSLPPRPWHIGEDSIGGRRISGGGIGASHIVRRDMILILPLRFRETDWPSVVALIRWGQSEETFTWFPDSNLATSFSVWLHAPEAGSNIRPQRVPDYPKLFELVFTLRRADLTETPWNLDFFGQL